MLRRFSLVALGSAFSSMLWSVSAYANQFIVYLPSVTTTQTAQVKTIAPDAFYTQLESGQRVLQVGRYNNLPLAQKRVQEFRQAGFAAEIRSVAPKVSSVPPLPPPIPVQPYPAPAPVSSPNPSLPPALPGVPSAVDTSAPTPIEVSRPTTAPQPISSLPPAPPVAPVPVPAVPAETVPQEELRYFVIIPTTSNSIMQRVRAIAPTAKFKSSNRGPYIEVQGYPDRASAETMSATMRGQGFDARVAYF